MRPGMGRRSGRSEPSLISGNQSGRMQSQREGSVLELLVGCIFGWVFGIFSICCLFNRRGNTLKFRNGIYLGFALRVLFAINEANDEFLEAKQRQAERTKKLLNQGGVANNTTTSIQDLSQGNVTSTADGEKTFPNATMPAEFDISGVVTVDDDEVMDALNYYEQFVENP